MTIESTNASKIGATNILSDLARELDEGVLSDTYEVVGVKWTMQTLVDHEVNWVNRYVSGTSMLSMITSSRAPTLGIGIRAINGKPIASFFQEEWAKDSAGTSQEVLQMQEEQNPYVKQYWFAEYLFKWLAARPPKLIAELWDCWQKLVKRQEEAETAMGKYSRLGGDSNSRPMGSKESTGTETPSLTLSVATPSSSGGGNS